MNKRLEWCGPNTYRLYKYCRKCETDKLVSEFYTDNSKPDTLRTICKVCDDKNRKKTYHKPHNLIKESVRRKEFREQNPELYHRINSENWKRWRVERELKEEINEIYQTNQGVVDNC